MSDDHISDLRLIARLERASGRDASWFDERQTGELTQGHRERVAKAYCREHNEVRLASLCAILVAALLLGAAVMVAGCSHHERPHEEPAPTMAPALPPEPVASA